MRKLEVETGYSDQLRIVGDYELWHELGKPDRLEIYLASEVDARITQLEVARDALMVSVNRQADRIAELEEENRKLRHTIADAVYREMNGLKPVVVTDD